VDALPNTQTRKKRASAYPQEEATALVGTSETKKGTNLPWSYINVGGKPGDPERRKDLGSTTQKSGKGAGPWAATGCLKKGPGNKNRTTGKNFGMKQNKGSSTKKSKEGKEPVKRCFRKKEIGQLVKGTRGQRREYSREMGATQVQKPGVTWARGGGKRVGVVRTMIGKNAIDR